MTTPPPPLSADDPSYPHEAYLNDVPLPNVSYPPEGPVGLHLRLHVAEERYRDLPPFLGLRYREGTRVYVHARPYVLVPDIRLTVALGAGDLAPGGPAGRVTDVAHRGWRRLDVGTAQAWLYPAEGTLVLWEASLHDRHRAGADPAGDPAHGLLWDGCEGALLRVLAPWEPVRLLVTTWEDAYPRPAWEAFLDGRGYLTRPPAAFVKWLLPVGASG